MARDQRPRPPFMDFEQRGNGVEDAMRYAAERMKAHAVYPPRMNTEGMTEALLEQIMAAQRYAGYIQYPDRIEPVTVDQMYQQELPVIDVVPFRGVWMSIDDAVAKGADRVVADAWAAGRTPQGWIPEDWR